MRKIISTMIALFMLSATGFAQSGTTGPLTWDLSNGTLIVSGTGAMPDYPTGSSTPWSSYTSSITAVVIEDGVTRIGNYAFYECSKLTFVTIGNSVTTIGNYAFYNCSSLTDITIPNSVTSIGDGTFYNCSGLTSVTIGNSVKSIGAYAFYNCSSLTDITIPNSVTSIGNSAFYGTPWYNNQTDGVIYINDVLYNYKGDMPGGTVVNVREGTVSISPSAFYNCSGLTSVTIPNSVTSIGNYAFRSCTGLTEITIPNDVTSIGAYAFYNCSSLTDITIPNSVTSIGEYTFYKCSSLTDITIPNSVTSIGNSAFFYCSGLTSVTIPNSVTNIGAYAFYGTPWYNNQTDGVIYINDVLYNYKGDMPGGTVVNVREGTVSISPDAFYNCSGLTSVTIPNSVTSIGNRAFYGCSSLNSVIIPNSVTSIGNRAFERCSGLTEITIPNSVTSIGNYAFEGCSALMAIDVSENNTAYASENGVLFNKAKSDLIKYPEGKQDASYNIPNSVTSIGEYAFSSCSALTSVTIGNSVTSIGGFAFYYCSGLTSVTNLNPTPQSINSNVFQNVDLINATLYVPAESVEDYKAAEIWKDFKEIKAYIPSAIESPTVGSSINIYPNPVVESFRINGITAPTEVIVTDLSGRTVLQQTINAGESVAVGNLPKGVYIVRIEGKTVKVVKR